MYVSLQLLGVLILPHYSLMGMYLFYFHMTCTTRLLSAAASHKCRGIATKVKLDKSLVKTHCDLNWPYGLRQFLGIMSLYATKFNKPLSQQPLPRMLMANLF